MKGVDTERRCSAVSGSTSELGEVAEVAHSPIIFAEQSIKLTSQTPAARAWSKGVRQIAARRSHDQAELRADPARIDLQSVITKRQPCRQWQVDPLPVFPRYECEP